MPTILVTGGAGFIGSCFVRTAVAAGDCDVVTLDKLAHSGGTAAIDAVLHNSRHQFVAGDICDESLVAGLLEKHRPAAVVNFAAETHVDRSIVCPADFLENNVVGTFRLLEACRVYWSALPAAEREKFRFLQASTDEVYGSAAPGEVFGENSPFAPNSPYSASKAAGDHFVRAYYQTYGLPVLTTHSSNNYGPFQLPEKLIPHMILAAVAGRELPLYGDGLHVRDWIFVEDNCRAIRAVLAGGRPGRTYNVGGGSLRTNLETVEMVCSILDRLRPDAVISPRKSLIRRVADRPGHDRRYALDTARITGELGWRSQTDFQAGLENTVRWYLENPGWVENIHKTIN